MDFLLVNRILLQLRLCRNRQVCRVRLNSDAVYEEHLVGHETDLIFVFHIHVKIFAFKRAGTKAEL